MHAPVHADEEKATEETTTVLEPIELSSSNYDDIVSSSSSPILVVFDGPQGDSKTQVSHGILQEMSQKLSTYGIKTGFVDCANTSDNKKICLNAALNSVPSFQLFLEAPTVNPYTKKMIRKPSVYNGRSVSSRSIESF